MRTVILAITMCLANCDKQYWEAVNYMRLNRLSVFFQVLPSVDVAILECRASCKTNGPD